MIATNPCDTPYIENGRYRFLNNYLLAMNHHAWVFQVPGTLICNSLCIYLEWNTNPKLKSKSYYAARFWSNPHPNIYGTLHHENTCTDFTAESVGASSSFTCLCFLCSSSAYLDTSFANSFNFTVHWLWIRANFSADTYNKA